LAKEKDDFMKALDNIDLIGEDQAEKKRVEALKAIGKYDEREQEKEAAKNKDPVHKI